MSALGGKRTLAIGMQGETSDTGTAIWQTNLLRWPSLAFEWE